MRILRSAILSIGLISSVPVLASELESIEVQPRVVPHEQAFDAVIEAVNKATVSARTAGTVTHVYFDVDDYVEKDAVMVRFRDKQERAALKAAEAKHQEAEAEFKRATDLLERKLISQSAYDKAEAAIKAARAALEQVQEQLSYTEVRAPYSGIVVARHVEPGESANPGQPLMTGLSLESLRAVANVSQADIDAIRGLGQARVLLPAVGGNKSVSVERLTFSPYADPVTHTFPVRVELPEGQHGVYPGTYAKAVFVTGEREAMLLPRSAVVQRSEVSAVYTVDAEGRIGFRQLRLGRVIDDEVEVLAGLEAGERVALDPIRAGVLLKEQRAGR